MKLTLKDNIEEILPLFNEREREAMGKVYVYLLKDLITFTDSLYRGANINIDAEDEVHEVYIKLWDDKSKQFDSLSNIKGYLFISIRNRFLNNVKHGKIVDRYNKQIITSSEYFISEMAEVELFSIFRGIENFLPKQCLAVFNEYMKGLNTKEIAQKLNKSEFTIYKQKKAIIDILRAKFNKTMLDIIIPILS